MHTFDEDYHEIRDVEHFDLIIRREVETSGIVFDEEQRVEYERALKILSAYMPYDLPSIYAAMSENLKRVVETFFSDDLMSWYTEEELHEVVLLKKQIMQFI